MPHIRHGISFDRRIAPRLLLENVGAEATFSQEDYPSDSKDDICNSRMSSPLSVALKPDARATPISTALIRVPQPSIVRGFIATHVLRHVYRSMSKGTECAKIS